MKKLLLSVSAAIFSLAVFAASPTTVTEKVLKAFNASFKNAKQVVWDENPEANVYEVKFLDNNIRSRITYDPEGNILKAIRYYHEEHLPILIKGKLKQKFAGKKVFGVTEVASEDNLEYHIVLEDAKNWVIVISDAQGYMSVDKKYKKA